MLFTVKKRKTFSLFEGLLKNTTKELKLKLLIIIIIGILTNDKYKYFLLLVLFNIEKIIKSIVVIRLLIKVYLFNPINTLDKDNIHKASKRFLENSSLLIRLYIINNNDTYFS